MNRYQSMALNCALALLFVSGGLLALAWHVGRFAPISAATTASTTTYYYGANNTYMVNAVQHIWPQENGPYCAIATGMAVTNYVDQEDHLTLRFSTPSNQYAIATADQKAGASRWGYAKPINATAGITNIAPDRGLDPRAAAYIQYHYSPQGTIFHDYIYRWQFHYKTAPPFHWQAIQATTSLFRAWLRFPEPMSVIINGGEHSVLVTGGWTSNSIVTNYPANIVGVIVRDPMFAGSISRFEVDNNQWTNHGTDFGVGYYTMWSRFYGQNPDFSVNKDDPEPSVGIYRPISGHPEHWYQGFTWIRRDTNSLNGYYSPDWAFTDGGTLLTAP